MSISTDKNPEELSDELLADDLLTIYLNAVDGNDHSLSEIIFAPGELDAGDNAEMISELAYTDRKQQDYAYRAVKEYKRRRDEQETGIEDLMTDKLDGFGDELY